MARTTHCNIILKNTSIFAINICPLNDARLFTLLTAFRTFIRMSLFAPHPLMKPSVANFSTFPSIIVFIAEDKLERFIKLRRITGLSLSVSKLSAQSYNVFSRQFNLTFPRTTWPCEDFTRRLISLIPTHVTSYKHNLILASI